jgi:iron complex transport system ATP-binding protein
VVTHHLEELPTATTHALLLREGGAVAAGPLGATITSEHVSAAYRLPVEVTRSGGRLHATAGDRDLPMTGAPR